jgi:DNA repair protein RecO (recombination protein O)
LETTPAILLRRTKLTDTSLIVTWLTEQHGRVKTVGKGARGAKSPFAGVLDLFFLCEISYVRSRRTELHGLREVRLVEPHAQLRFDYPRLALASYFAELLELVTEPEHPVPEMYDLLRRALGYLNANPASQRALTHFETEVAKSLGIHQESVAPATAIARAYHRLPGSRDALPLLPVR